MTTIAGGILLAILALFVLAIAIRICVEIFLAMIVVLSAPLDWLAEIDITGVRVCRALGRGIGRLTHAFRQPSR